MSLYFIEIRYSGGEPPYRTHVSQEQLGQSFDEWLANYVDKVSARPRWVRIGDLVLYSQNVLSIELLETMVEEV